MSGRRSDRQPLMLVHQGLVRFTVLCNSTSADAIRPVRKGISPTAHELEPAQVASEATGLDKQGYTHEKELNRRARTGHPSTAGWTALQAGLRVDAWHPC